MNKLLIESGNLLFKSITNKNLLVLSKNYAKSRNILRNRYYRRKPDFTHHEYNETVTVIPKEFQDQDEYLGEKEVNQRFLEHYKRQKEERQFKKTIHLPFDYEEKKKGSVCEEELYKKQAANDMPIANLDNPYKPSIHQCIFCKHNIKLDYKNTQLLSQFVSPQTGLLYKQSVTGLCHFKYEELEKCVFESRKAGLMPFFYKEHVFVNDPLLFDPFRDNLKKIPNNYDKRTLEEEEEVNTKK